MNRLCQVRRTDLLLLRSFGELLGLVGGAVVQGARGLRCLPLSEHWHPGLPPSRQGGQVTVKCVRQGLPSR